MLLIQVSFGNKENHGLSVSDKNTTFDLFCTSETGEQFVVEMQFSAQTHYADRMLSYATYPIRAQLSEKLASQREKQSKGEKVDKMNYGLLPIYVISLLNFSIKHDSEEALEEGLISRYSIRNDHCEELMTESLRFVYLELDRLRVTKEHPEQCRTLLERFAFSLKYMHELEERPEKFEDDILKLLYNAAEFANMSVKQQTDYESFMRTELDIIAEKNFARESGLAEGLAEGRAEGEKDRQLKVARTMISFGESDERIAAFTELSSEEIQSLRNQ